MSSTQNRTATRDIATASCDGFEIGRLEHKLRYQIAVAPHRHTYYEVFWSVVGAGDHYIDFVSYKMTPDTLFFVSPGQIHYSEIDRCVGYALFFTEQFLSSQVPRSFLRRLPFYRLEGHEQAVHLRSEQIPLFYSLFRRLEREYLSKSFSKEDMLRAYLQVLLLEAEQLYVPQKNHPDQPSSLLIREFKDLIEEHFLTKTAVKDYSQLLHVTANHLNATAKQMTGETAGELIRTRVLLEAKRLLVHSEQSILQISRHLNFKDPAYFGRFFKRCTNQSPGEFRQTLRKKYQNFYK